MINKILFFSATWCKNCAPTKQRLKDNGIEFESIDAEDQWELTEKYKVKSLPTMIAINDDEEIWRISGTVLMNELSKFKEFMEKAVELFVR